MQRLIALLLALAALPAAVSACGGNEAGADGRLRVVAGTGQAADLARAAGGGRAAVQGLLPPNADPHDFELRPDDVAALADADVIVRSGGEVDHWLDDAIEASGSDAEVVVLGDHVQLRGDDPHWWQDPRNAITALDALRDAYARAAPESRREFERATARYQDRLRTLDGAIAACIERIPPDRRTLVTTHDALGYYAARYGLEVVGTVIPSRSTLAQPSAGEVDALIAAIRSAGVPAIFAEAAVAPDVEEAIADAAGARVGKALWADALGPPDSDGATYLGALASNTAAIVDGLTGGREQCRP